MIVFLVLLSGGSWLGWAPIFLDFGVSVSFSCDWMWEASPSSDGTSFRETNCHIFSRTETPVNEKPKSEKNATQIEKTARVFPLQAKSLESIPLIREWRETDVSDKTRFF